MCLEISLEIEFLNSYPWKAPLMQKHNISINLTELDFMGLRLFFGKLEQTDSGKLHALRTVVSQTILMN